MAQNASLIFYQIVGGVKLTTMIEIQKKSTEKEISIYIGENKVAFDLNQKNRLILKYYY